MKRIRNIIAITLSIIILTNSTLSYTTVCASPQLPSTSISIIKAQDRAFTVKWKKKSNITGYQIQYSTNSNFKNNNKIIKIKKAKIVSKNITGLKASKKYYIRIRTYKGKKYSNWSKKKNIIIKPNKENHCTNNNNHSIKCGNIGMWFGSRREVDTYFSSVCNKWGTKYKNEEITWEEYTKNCPQGYECWSCSYCGKWTGNFKYN